MDTENTRDGKKCKDCPPKPMYRKQRPCKGGKPPCMGGVHGKEEEIRHQTGMKEIYQKRKETIERVFADGKENME